VINRSRQFVPAQAYFPLRPKESSARSLNFTFSFAFSLFFDMIMPSRLTAESLWRERNTRIKSAAQGIKLDFADHERHYFPLFVQDLALCS
jgi:hypothetical protein